MARSRGGGAPGLLAATDSRDARRASAVSSPKSLRAAGAEILQEPVDQPYGVRDAAVRDPSGNHLRLSQPLAAQG